MRKTKVITYLRVSSTSQSDDDRYGFKRQDKIAKQSEIKHNLERATIITDVISGASVSRDGLDSIPQKALELQATGVNLSELDRLSRATPNEAYIILDTLLSFGLDIYSYDLRSRVNYNDPESVLEVHEKIKDAYKERHTIRNRTYGGLLVKAAEGKPPRPINRYGFLNNEFLEHEAMWVRYVHEQSLIYGSRKIADILNAQHVPTRGGKPWDRYMVDHLLFDPVYIGQYQYGREGVCTNPHCRERRSGSYRNKVMQTMLCKRCGSEMAMNTQTVHIPAMVDPSLRAASNAAIERRKVNHGKQGRREEFHLQGRILCQTCLDEGRNGTMSGYKMRNYHTPETTKNDYQNKLRTWLELTLTNGYKGTEAAKEMGLNQPKQVAWRMREKTREVIEAHKTGKLSLEDALKHVPPYEPSPLLYYGCRVANEKPYGRCPNKKLVPAVSLHDAVREALKELFENQEQLAEALKIEPEQPRIDYGKEISNLRDELKRIQQGYRKGIYEAGEAEKDAMDIRGKIHALEVEMNKPRAKTRDLKSFRESVLVNFEGSSLRDLMALANAVVVIDKKLEFWLELR